MGVACGEILTGANPPWPCTQVSVVAANLLQEFGADWMKEMFWRSFSQESWGHHVPTESSAGTDVGSNRCKPIPPTKRASTLTGEKVDVEITNSAKTSFILFGTRA